jgi:hypothetical protein
MFHSATLIGLARRDDRSMQEGIELGRAAGATPHALGVVHDRRADGVMVDAEGGGDGADLPVLA